MSTLLTGKLNKMLMFTMVICFTILFPVTAQTSGGALGCGICVWYGTEYPLCCTATSGWGWESNTSCISRNECERAGQTVIDGDSTPAPTTAPTNPPNNSTTTSTYSWWGWWGSTTTTSSYTNTTTSAQPTPVPGTTTTSSGSTTGNITVRARGVKGGEHLEIQVNGTTVATFTMSTSYADYKANGSGTVRAAFTNDDGQSDGMDIQVDYADINGTRYQAENQSINTGVYQNGQCGGSNSEWLHCSGYIEFKTSGTTTSTAGTTTSNWGSTTTTSSGGTSGSVYLTFDDGPTGNAQTLCSSLKNAGCNAATMFVIGQNMPGNSSAYKSAGFSVQNHSQTHSHMTSWSYQQVYNDLQQCSQAIQNAGFPKPTRIRLPYLESNSTIQSACSNLGLSIVSPTVDTQDWNGASTQSIINACNSLNAGGNPLMHENQANTLAAVSTIVQNLKNRGLGFAQY